MLQAEELQQRDLFSREFNHRLNNSLQLIVSVLASQSRAAGTVEAAAQLNTAASRVAAFGRVHGRLHLLSLQKTVDLKQYLRELCDDISILLLSAEPERAIVVTGRGSEVPTGLITSLGLIASELITNSVKHSTGDIVVRIGKSGATISLSVTDDGPGLAEKFNPASSPGLGMKIIQSLAKQIGGTLQFGPGDGARCNRVTVSFPSQQQAT